MKTGLQTGISYEQQLCRLYNKHEIEDEFQSVLSCPVYNQIRSVFLPNINTESAAVDTFS